MDNQNTQKPVTEETAKRLNDLLAKIPAGTQSFELAKKPVYRLRNSQLLAGVAGTIGLVLFALGVENAMSNIAVLSHPFVQIALGLILLSVSGLLLKKLN
ncbi:MAG: hypothetical protein NUV69_00245 [Candidatus Curtissbacteria bacterium]|nr:hypothetical protein [Candidatus Curtissbacteria bacterium]